MNVKTLAEILGHTSVKTTLDIYSHMVDDMQKQAAEKIDKVLVVDENSATIGTEEFTQAVGHQYAVGDHAQAQGTEAVLVAQDGGDQRHIVPDKVIAGISDKYAHEYLQPQTRVAALDCLVIESGCGGRSG